MICGATYAFKEFLKARWDKLAYTDLVLSGGAITKTAWVLPVSAETEETGTLADYLRELGVAVTEVDLDEEEDEDDDAERDADGFIDREAEEAGEEDEE